VISMRCILRQFSLLLAIFALALPLLVMSASPVLSAPVASKKPQANARLSNMDALFGKTVAKIEFRGLSRIEKDAVQAKLVTKLQQPLSSESARGDIRAIFGMGFFEDIEILGEADGERVNLTYVLRERPVISNIRFDGNERIGTNDLKEVVKLREWAIFDANKAKEDAALIQKHYEEKGFYLAKVRFEVKSVKPGEVELIYRINDFDKVQIKKITFLNNRHYSDDQLKNILQETREGGFMSFLSGSGSFKESAFKQDLQRLTYWYLDHGYVKFRYENPVVTVSEDKRWLFVSIYLDEGDQYKMGELEFGGDLLFTKDELRQELLLKQGEVFSISKRNFDIQRLTEKYQDLGYAFVNVVPKMNLQEDAKAVSMEYDFEKGSLVYFGEINVAGNTKTHDKVIRRELKIREGELYSGSKLRQSRENVERLGFFAPGEVVFNTSSPKGNPDVLNIEISVKERSTGTITLGAGYGSIQGFFFTGTVAEINFLGRGQTLSLASQYSTDQNNKSFNLGFTDPYAFDSPWSLGYDLYYVGMQIPRKYFTRKLGFDVRLGYPVADFVNAYITYKNEGLKATPTEGVLFDPVEAERDSGVLSSIVWSLVRDKRNNRYETTDGNYQSVSLETAGLGGTKKFVKWVLNNRYYARVVGDLVFRNSVETGQVYGLAGEQIPPSERFYLGGPNNMKGFEQFSLGPTYVDVAGNVRPKGGTFQAFALFELEYPLIREAGLKWALFYDIGNTWDTFPKGNDFTLRQDWGFGLRWFSPIGPLRFEWGFPIKARGGELSPVFQFFIGPPF